MDYMPLVADWIISTGGKRLALCLIIHIVVLKDGNYLSHFIDEELKFRMLGNLVEDIELIHN